MLALASMLLVPAFFAFAHESGEGRPGEGSRPHHPFATQHRLFRIGEVVEIDTWANTILVQSLRPVEEGKKQEYVLISYDDETTFDKDRQDVDESGISVGDKIHARGDVNTESDEYFAEIDADYVLLWTKLEPKRPLFQHGHNQPE